MAYRPLTKNEYSGKTELIFEFCVDGIAISAQSKNRTRLRAWQNRIASHARTALADAAIVEGLIEIGLSEFSETRSRDRDNLAKPILDAMQGILFQNDKQVARPVIEWCDINERYKVRFMSKSVADAPVAGREFIWIRIRRQLPRETLIP